MFGFLVALFDLGVLTHGSIKNGIESAENRAEAKSIGRSWYIAGNGQTRLVINDHKASVTAEGVRDLVTGKLIEDYKANREKEKAEYEAREKAQEEQAVLNNIKRAKKRGITWTLCSDRYYYNTKNGLKAHDYGCRRFIGSLYDDTYRYYIDNRKFYLIRNEEGEIDLEIESNKSSIYNNGFQENIDYDYSKYIKEIEYNQKLFEKYKNIDYINKYEIELYPVSIEEFKNKYESSHLDLSNFNYTPRTKKTCGIY